MAERNVLLKNVQHPFLVGLHYSFQTTDKLYFVLDFVNGGEVSTFEHVGTTCPYKSSGRGVGEGVVVVGTSGHYKNTRSCAAN